MVVDVDGVGGGGGEEEAFNGVVDGVITMVLGGGERAPLLAVLDDDVLREGGSGKPHLAGWWDGWVCVSEVEWRISGLRGCSGA